MIFWQVRFRARGAGWGAWLPWGMDSLSKTIDDARRSILGSEDRIQIRVER